MSWFLYILQSQKDGDYYKGVTQDIEKRLFEHNTGQSRFTSTKMPWNLVYVFAFETKREALIEERRVKKLNRLSLEKLIMKG
jgi:putative endonuclease